MESRIQCHRKKYTYYTRSPDHQITTQPPLVSYRLLGLGEGHVLHVHPGQDGDHEGLLDDPEDVVDDGTEDEERATNDEADGRGDGVEGATEE